MLSPALLHIILLSHLIVSDQQEPDHVLVYKSNNETSGNSSNSTETVTAWWKVDRKTPNSPKERTSTSALSFIKDFFHNDSKEEGEDPSDVFGDLSSEKSIHNDGSDDHDNKLESPFLVSTLNEENINTLIQSPFLVSATQDDLSVDDSFDAHSDIVNNNDYENLEDIGVSTYLAMSENTAEGDEGEEGLFDKIRRILREKLNGDNLQNILLQQANYPLG